MIEYVNPKFYEMREWSWPETMTDLICPNCGINHRLYITGSSLFHEEARRDLEFNVILWVISVAANKGNFCSVACMNDWANNNAEKVVMELLKYEEDREAFQARIRL